MKEVNDLAVNLLYVALGGGLGAVCRYLCSLIPAFGVKGFPWGTLLVNFLGCLLIGVAAEALGGVLVSNPQLSDKVNLFLKVGFCGGFTTFSTFSLEMLNLVDDGKALWALAYACVSVTLCLAGVLLGRGLMKIICAK